jgi:mRNA-degrading endonuclease RelE of RelBE toxin-antitoxin system
VLAALAGLADQPRARRCVKLTGSIYRLRLGPFRIIYAVFDRDQMVLVGKIARREKDTYDDLDTLFS